MNLSNVFKRPRNKCGVNNFQCGTCGTCRQKEEDRWNRIWEEKYGKQERRYYELDAMTRQTMYSPGRSSLSTQEPIDDLDMSPMSGRPTFVLLRNEKGHIMGRKRKEA